MRVVPIRFTMSGAGTAVLMWAGVAVLCVLALVFNPFDKSEINLWLGVVVLILTLQPVGKWLRSRQLNTIPVLELNLAFYAACFGVAAFVTPTWLRVPIDERDFTIALIATIIGVVSVRVGYQFASVSNGRIAHRIKPALPTNNDKLVFIAIYPVALIASLLIQHYNISALTQPVQVVRQFALAWVFCAAMSGTVPRPYRIAAFLVILPIDFALFSGIRGGFLAGFVTYGEMLFVIFVFFKKRIPLWVPLAIVAVFFVMQPGKRAYRNAVWGHDLSHQNQPGISLYLSDAINNSSFTNNSRGTLNSLNDSYTRLNQLYTTAMAMSVADSQNMFLHGQTYTPLLTVWIPRAIWHDKPRQDMGNIWGRQYGLLDPTDYSTSYNFPWLPEMYLNFGWPGVVLISLGVGWLMGELKRGVFNRATTPIGLAFAITMASAFFWPESNFSMMLGGVIIGWITIALFAMGLRTFVHQYARQHYANYT